MTSHRQFARECDHEITEQGSDSALLATTREWMDGANAHKSSYHFSWLGRPIIEYPQDVVLMQELIWDPQPDLIVETGIAHGDRELCRTKRTFLQPLQYLTPFSHPSYDEDQNPTIRISSADGAWINGGFFVCEPAVFDYLTEGDATVFEQGPLQSAVTWSTGEPSLLLAFGTNERKFPMHLDNMKTQVLRRGVV